MPWVSGLLIIFARISWSAWLNRVKSSKGERVVPLFPELRQELEDLAELVQPGVEVPATDKVIKRYHHTEQNLRKALHRIADHAGVERWQKPFICLRASRRTELERSGGLANHVLNDWFGHSGAVAETYYLQTTEADFDLAVKQLGAPHRTSSKRGGISTQRYR